MGNTVDGLGRWTSQGKHSFKKLSYFTETYQLDTCSLCALSIDGRIFTRARGKFLGGSTYFMVIRWFSLMAIAEQAFSSA